MILYLVCFPNMIFSVYCEFYIGQRHQRNCLKLCITNRILCLQSLKMLHKASEKKPHAYKLNKAFGSGRVFKTDLFCSRLSSFELKLTSPK